VGRAAPSAGTLLREWRRRRRLSQLELASGSACSARHLSFIETGRARPSREMVLHLADRLDVPLRERNRMLLAAGHAPSIPERPLEDDEMAPVRAALERLLAAHEPFPAVVVDRGWRLVMANRGIDLLLEGVGPALLEPPANALRIALHPEGMAPRILNLPEWSAHLLQRLRRQAAVTGDPELERLHDELAGYPGVVVDEPPDAPSAAADIALTLRLRAGAGELAFLATATVFGAPRDVSVAELAVEAFFPADAATARALAAQQSPLDGPMPMPGHGGSISSSRSR
jgi:transcriptional regulator with XRE-family HTH domain